MIRLWRFDARDLVPRQTLWLGVHKAAVQVGRVTHLPRLHGQQRVELPPFFFSFDVKCVRFQAGLAEHHHRDAPVEQANVTDFLPTDAPRIPRPLVDRPQALLAGDDQVAWDVDVPQVHVVHALSARDDLLGFGGAFVVRFQPHAIWLFRRTTSQSAAQALGDSGGDLCFAGGVGQVVHHEDRRISQPNDRLDNDPHSPLEHALHETNGAVLGGINGRLLKHAECPRLDAAHHTGTGQYKRFAKVSIGGATAHSVRQHPLVGLPLVDEIVVGGKPGQIGVHDIGDIGGTSDHAHKQAPSQAFRARFQPLNELPWSVDGALDRFVEKVSHTRANVGNEIRRCSQNGQAAQNAKDLLGQLGRIVRQNDPDKRLWSFEDVTHDKRREHKWGIRNRRLQSNES